MTVAVSDPAPPASAGTQPERICPRCRLATAEAYVPDAAFDALKRELDIMREKYDEVLNLGAEVEGDLAAAREERDALKRDYDDACSAYRQIRAQLETARESIEDLVGHFAYWTEANGGYSTGGLSALEHAFDVLGWEDPHECPEARCDEQGCLRQISCGTPSPSGYRNTCYEHRPNAEATHAD